MFQINVEFNHSVHGFKAENVCDAIAMGLQFVRQGAGVTIYSLETGEVILDCRNDGKFPYVASLAFTG